MLQRLHSHLNDRTLGRAKFKPITLSVPGSSFLDVANIYIFVIMHDLCLLPAQTRYVTINSRYLESRVQLVDRSAHRKFNGGAENLILQAQQFQKVGICSKSIGDASISHY
jgi:hypothetical protein